MRAKLKRHNRPLFRLPPQGARKRLKSKYNSCLAAIIPQGGGGMQGELGVKAAPTPAFLSKDSSSRGPPPPANQTCPIKSAVGADMVRPPRRRPTGQRRRGGFQPPLRPLTPAPLSPPSPSPWRASGGGGQAPPLRRAPKAKSAPRCAPAVPPIPRRR